MVIIFLKAKKNVEDGDVAEARANCKAAVGWPLICSIIWIMLILPIPAVILVAVVLFAILH